MVLSTLLVVGALISFGLAALSVPTGRVNTVGLGLFLVTLATALPLFN